MSNYRNADMSIKAGREAVGLVERPILGGRSKAVPRHDRETAKPTARCREALRLPERLGKRLPREADPFTQEAFGFPTTRKPPTRLERRSVARARNRSVVPR